MDRTIVLALAGALTAAWVPAQVASQTPLAPSFGVSRWTTDDGPPSHFVPDLVQTSDGVLWTWNPDLDRIFLMGNGPEEGGVYFNGRKTLPPTSMAAGETYRLRFMNITVGNSGVRVRVVRDGYPTRWTPIAKDGADLPARWRIEEVAESPVRVGETIDFAFTPEPGEYTVEVRSGGGALFASQKVEVPGPVRGGG